MVMQGKVAIDPVATAFEQKLAAKDYKGAYDSVDPAWKQAQTREEFEGLFQMIETGLGPLQSKTMTSFNINRKTSGSVAVAQYSAVYAKGTGTIKATFAKGSGEWRVMGWRVESPQLISVLTCKKCQKVAQSLARFCPSCGESMVDPPK